MSVVPLPKPDPEPAKPAEDADGWALLEALRRRLDDQAAQGRKTQVQVTQLADSIAALVAEQRRRSKWLNLNSFVAYVIFTVVVGAGFYALYQSRASELLAARDTARHERDLAAQRADDATAKLAARDKADTAAWETYQLLEAGKRTEAAGKLAALGAQPLSRTERAVLAARAHETQVMEVDAALKAAAAAFKAGRYADVIAPLEAALVGEPAGARSGAMHYYVGVAYAKANDLAKATQHLQQAVGTDTEHEDVRFQLASALDRSGQYAKARAEYDQFATAHPQSSFAVFAMRRSATLARMPAVAPAAAAPKVAPPGAAPTAGSATPSGAPAPKAGAPSPSGAGAAPSGAGAAPSGAGAVPAGALPASGAPTARPTPVKPATTPLKPAGASPTGASPTGASPTGASPTGASPTGAAPTGAANGASPTASDGARGAATAAPTEPPAGGSP